VPDFAFCNQVAIKGSSRRIEDKVTYCPGHDAIVSAAVFRLEAVNLHARIMSVASESGTAHWVGPNEIIATEPFSAA